MIFMYRMIRRRRRSSVTNYKKRIALLKSRTLRVVVRRSNRAITMQVIEYSGKGDRIIASANSRELKGMGWEPRCNIPTAYLTGMLLAKKTIDRKKEFVLDIGLYRPVKGSVIFAAAKGFKDSGANLLGEIEFDNARLSGAHIAGYADKLDENGYKTRFSDYAKSGFDAKDIIKKFESIRNELNGK